MGKILDWLGFGSQKHATGHHETEDDHHGGSHGHTHGVIDATIATTDRGIWAIKWSFIILGVTSLLQMAVVFATGSVALLSDAIHNMGDSATAVPLGIAFLLARRKPSRTFTYGYGRVEDLAGLLIVLIILFSAVVAGYESIHRLLHPQPITRLLWVAIAGIIGFIGNETVAVFRIKVGREIDSAALIADGYHARADGLTSLAVVLGALGVWLGYPLADPLIGLIITIAIAGIVWQSARAVLTRMLDGVEPGIIAEIQHAAEHVPDIKQILKIQGRWIGHKLHADISIDVANNLSLSKAKDVAQSLEQALRHHLPALGSSSITFAMADTIGASPMSAPPQTHGHRHAPEPFDVHCALAEGHLEIIDTPQGERFRLTLTRASPGLQATVRIMRPAHQVEIIPLTFIVGETIHQSIVAPQEPHEFKAELQLSTKDQRQTLPFEMNEPDSHH